MRHPFTEPDGLSSAGRLMFALASGLAVANVYYAQPLIDTIAQEVKISRAVAGVIISATQIGYFLGLLFIVPLGDILNRRRLLLWQTALLGLALFIPAIAPNAATLLAGFGVVGLLSVIAQTFVAYAADIASERTRGRAVGIVTTGIILGILLARTVSGALSDHAGWRSVFLVAGALTLGLLLVLARIVPQDRRPPAPLGYGALVTSTLGLFVRSRELRIRATIGCLIFATITMLWAPMVLPLSAPPWSLSHTQVGLVGLAGAMGALGATFAGRLADRGHANRVTGIGLGLMLVSWTPIAMLDRSLSGFLLGVLVIDFALQSVHVSNQALLHQSGAGARGRLTAAYMLLYSVGCAVGSLLSTVIFAVGGWIGVCAAGGVMSLVALAFWVIATRPDVRVRLRGRTPKAGARP
ncbi:MFS transporter [Xanthobacter sp. V3C-3]|uniref:MFS transporter n=1 Tax=Xanthobacter lutulentifluminis TaxID=3119935 RepID=UPI00372B2984